MSATTTEPVESHTSASEVAELAREKQSPKAKVGMVLSYVRIVPLCEVTSWTTLRVNSKHCVHDTLAGGLRRRATRLDAVGVFGKPERAPISDESSCGN